MIKFILLNHFPRFNYYSLTRFKSETLISSYRIMRLFVSEPNIEKTKTQNAFDKSVGK